MESRGDLDLEFINRVSHADPALHLLGESLAPPTVVTAIGDVSFIGTSNVAAREDHQHSLPTNGLTLNGRFAYMLINRYCIVSTANLVTTAAYVQVPGVTQTIAANAGDLFVVQITVDFEATSGVLAANEVGIGCLHIGGAAQAQIATGNVIRATVGQEYIYTAPSAGNYTFDLRIAHTITNTFRAYAPHTTMSIQQYAR